MRVFRAWGVLEFSIRHTRIRFPKRNASRRGLAPRGMRFFRCFNHIAQINPHQPDFQRREMISGRSGLICATWLKQRKNAFRGDAFRAKTPFALGNDFACGGWRIPKCPALGKYAFFVSASRQTLRLSRKTRSEAKINLGKSQKPLVAEIHRK